MKKNNITYVLSIAGHDPSAGAGLTSDIKTFEQCGVYGLSVVSAITIQNDASFKAVTWVDVDQIKAQINVLFDAYNIECVKIGLIENIDVLNEIVRLIKKHNRDAKIIWDPILKSSSGFPFHQIQKQDIQSLLNQLYLITPNQPEFDAIGLLSNDEYACSYLLKGGHHQNPGTDVLYSEGSEFVFKGESFGGASKHGTGCVLSAAIAANVALGNSLEIACKKGKSYVEKFILSTDINIGWHKH